MDVIEEFKDKLRNYPYARYAADEHSISIFPDSETGFTVSLVIHGNNYTVYFDGWHEDFQDQEEALNCLAFGLSTDCRLKEYRRGNFTHKWTVESRERGVWAEESTTGLLLFPFWNKTEVRYLQNDLLGSRGS